MPSFGCAAKSAGRHGGLPLPGHAPDTHVGATPRGYPWDYLTRWSVAKHWL